MTQYHTYLDDSTDAGRETIQGVQNNGSQHGIGISTDIFCNNITANVITASQYNGSISGVTTYADKSGIATYSSTSGISTYSTSSGIATYSSTSGISTSVIGGIGSITQLYVTGISTIAVNSSSDALRINQLGSGNALVVEDEATPDSTPFVVASDGKVGIGTTNPSSPLYVVGNTFITGILTANRIISSVYGEFTGGTVSGTNLVGTALSISGISTFTNGPVLIGSGNSTGTASQPLQVTGGTYISGNLGIGSTNPTSKLYVVGDTFITGVITAATFSGNISNANYAVTSGVSTSVIGGISSVTQLNVTGISTLGITSITSLTAQQINVSGVVTATSYVSAGTTAVYSGAIGISTVDSNVIQSHYITYDTDNSAVNVSNFASGKCFDVIARNTSGGARNIIIRTSTTTTGHVAVPMLLNSGKNNITNGTISISNNSGTIIKIYNINGTVVGSYI